MTTRTNRAVNDRAPVPAPRGTVGLDVLDRPPGYHDLHPNVSLNFQLNRWLGWMTPQALTEVARTAARVGGWVGGWVGGYEDFTTAFLALGDRLLGEGRCLDAALRYRAAEFFLAPGDERRAGARRRFVDLVRDVYGIGAEHCAAVPYPGGALPAYRFGAPDRGSIVLFGGFDSYVEEFLPVMLALAGAATRWSASRAQGKAAPWTSMGCGSPRTGAARPGPCWTISAWTG